MVSSADSSDPSGASTMRLKCSPSRSRAPPNPSIRARTDPMKTGSRLLLLSIASQSTFREFTAFLSVSAQDQSQLKSYLEQIWSGALDRAAVRSGDALVPCPAVQYSGGESIVNGSLTGR
jgi:hypothetical protein